MHLGEDSRTDNRMIERHAVKFGPAVSQKELEKRLN
jgi:hypothetical protein